MARAIQLRDSRLMKLNIGICQMSVADAPEENLRRAEVMIQDAQTKGAQLVVLPEMFVCPYSNQAFVEFAEPERGTVWKALAQMASDCGVWLVGGSVPELDGSRIYNTSYVFSPKGEPVAKHRKMHLFDVDIPGRLRFMESDTLSPGNDCTVFDTPFGKIGLALCFDVRFPELFRLMALQGAQLVLVPGAFNMTTGPAHWELLLRTRAVDNQYWVAACAPASGTEGYVSYGNSLTADPWGVVTARLAHETALLVTQVDFDQNMRVRQRLPLLESRRTDVYQLEIVQRTPII